MAPPAATHPGVSYVMPVYNEVAYIDDAIASVLAQQYPGERELVVVLGPSTDGTTERVTERAAVDPRIRVVTSDELSIPLSLNLGIRAAAHDVIVRVDAHTELPADYTALGVATLQRTGAASVGAKLTVVSVQLAGPRRRSSRAACEGWQSVRMSLSWA
jgi:cellulose synthase/poly-beta-1,6-N-acetylglucosamine synthase-like glycosyltransferase